MSDLNPTIRIEETEQPSQETAESANSYGAVFTPKMPTQAVPRQQEVSEPSVSSTVAANKPVVLEREVPSIDLSSPLNLDKMPSPHSSDAWEATLSSVK